MSKLEEWIKDQESKGLTEKQLEDHLIGQGYNKEEIDKIFLEMRLKPKVGYNLWLMWIGISFIILLLVCGAIYLLVSSMPIFNNSYNNNLSNSGNGNMPLDDVNTNRTVFNETPSLNNSAINYTDNTNIPSNITLNNTNPANRTIINTSNETSVPRCGNGRRDFGEECDGYDFGGNYCWNFTNSEGIQFNGGAMKCTDDCKIDTTSCGYCGDGIVSTNSGERCEDSIGVVIFKKDGIPYEWDVSSVNPCKNFGYTYGTAVCNMDNCTWNIAGCNVKTNATCGNGILENDEECDYGILGPPGGTNCQSFNYTTTCINTTIVSAFNATTNTTYNTTLNITYYCVKWYIGGILSCTNDCRHDFNECR